MAVLCLASLMAGCELQTPSFPALLPTLVTHDVSGTVRSAAGNPIVNVTITFTAGRRATTITTVNAGGFFRIGGLEAGTIFITFSAPGFLTVTRMVLILEDVVLDVDLDPVPAAGSSSFGS
jgi:carboxypeptidase family protein